MSSSSKKPLENLSLEQRAALEARLLQRRSTRGTRSGSADKSRSSGEGAISFSQQRLWFLEQLDRGNPAYNIPLVLRLRGRLTVPALERALTEIQRRHETLRATFREVDGEPSLAHHAPAGVQLPVQSVSPSEGTDPEPRILAWIREEAMRPMNLATGPLMRCALLRVWEDDHVLSITLHHIVADAWSNAILQRELSVLYGAYLWEQPSPLPELPIQYAGWAARQREELQGEKLEQQLSYWRQQLGQETPDLVLPLDRPRPAGARWRGARLRFQCSPALAEGLNRLCQSENATLFMGALAAFKVLLYRYSGQTGVRVGVPVAGRERTELESLIGFFATTLVMHTDLGGVPTFRELLKRVRNTTLGAYSHQQVPFERLVEILAPERHLDRNALFQITFALQNVPAQPPALEGLTVEQVSFERGIARFDLSFFLCETTQGLEGVVEYNQDIFHPATISRMVAHYQELLRGAIQSPDQTIDGLSWLTVEERRQILEVWNQTRLAPISAKTVVERVMEQGEVRGEALAVKCGEKELTYGELRKRGLEVAGELRRRGVGKDQAVAVCMERSVEWVVALVGVWWAGGAYVPLDPAHPEERLQWMLKDTQTPVVVTDRRQAGRLGERTPKLLMEEVGETGAGLQEFRSQPGDLAYVIYTSGSTGEPKGVAIEHRGLMNLVSWHQQRYGVTERDRATQMAGLGFDASVWELWPYLSAGAQVHLIEEETRLKPELVRDWLVKEEITLTFVPTPLAEVMVGLEWPPEMKLRAMLTGGDRLKVYARKELPFELVNHYGPTESSVVATSGVVKREEECGGLLPSIGKPIGNTQVYVLDGERQVVPVGVVGELYIGGDGLARGYWKQEELTREKFVENPFKRGERMYRTGDQVKWNERGELEFVGRKDGQVKIRGFRIELGEIEAEMKKCEGVKEGVVEAREEGGERRLVGYVVWEEGKKSEVRKLREELKKRLPEYMVPAGWVELEKLPLTPNGKVDRKALPAPEGNLSPVEETVGSRTPVEELLCGIWEQLLRRSPVGVTENFFEIGGHSLLATRVMSRVRQTFGVELAVRVIFEGPTVRELGRCVEQARQGGRSSRVPKLERREHGQRTELSFAQQRLWFLDRMGHRAYHIAGAMRLEGAVNEGALEESFNDLVARHESLRTVFGQEEGRGYQEVKESLRVKLEREDWSGLGGEERERKARVRVQEEGEKEFDLEEGPLVRLGLIKLQEQEHLLLLTLHHAIADGWSMEILLREWSQGYEARVKGKEVGKVGEEGVRYRDYAVWQRQWLKGEVLEEELGYWRKRLEGAPGVLELPLDRPRKAVATHRGGRVEVKLGKELTEKLKQLGREEGASLFMVLLAGFQAVLGRYARSEDVVVGTPIANRQREEVEGVIGFFVNTLVLRGR